jgi:hypothetical protein
VPLIVDMTWTVMLCNIRTWLKGTATPTSHALCNLIVILMCTARIGSWQDRQDPSTLKQVRLGYYFAQVLTCYAFFLLIARCSAYPKSFYLPRKMLAMHPTLCAYVFYIPTMFLNFLLWECIVYTTIHFTLCNILLPFIWVLIKSWFIKSKHFFFGYIEVCT